MSHELQSNRSTSVRADIVFQTIVACFSIAAGISFILATRWAVDFFEDPDPRQGPAVVSLVFPFIVIGAIYGSKALVSLARLIKQRDYIVPMLVVLFGIGGIVPILYILTHLLFALL